MGSRSYVVAGWLSLLIVLSCMLYSGLQSDIKTQTAQVVSKMSDAIRALQNQTAKLSLSLDTPKFPAGPVFQPPEDDQNTLLIPEETELNNMEFLDLENLWMRYIENIQQACGVQHHMGAESDGGYHVCEKYLVKDHCLVYSFGSRRLYQFENDVTKNYGCEIHTFDPFDGQVDHKHSPNCTFHALGLGDQDSGSLLTLTSIKRKLNHTNKILDILKIDIEGAEWASLPQIVSSGEILQVKLLIVEFHICVWPCKNSEFRNKEQYLTRLTALRNIYQIGFRLYYFRQWTTCLFVDEKKHMKTGCHEVHFMRT